MVLFKPVKQKVVCDAGFKDRFNGCLIFPQLVTLLKKINPDSDFSLGIGVDKDIRAAGRSIPGKRHQLFKIFKFLKTPL